eukprot:3995443-Pyramimonas_sp.AAC.1
MQLVVCALLRRQVLGSALDCNCFELAPEPVRSLMCPPTSKHCVLFGGHAWSRHTDVTVGSFIPPGGVDDGRELFYLHCAFRWLPLWFWRTRKA